MNPDGVSYLDLSDRLLAGDWTHFVQGYWSPVLPAVMALARAIAGRGAAIEFEIAHGVLFLTVCGALAAWLFLLRECDQTLRATSIEHAERFSARPVRLAAHAAFAWTILWQSTAEILTPDPLLVTAVLVVSALLLRVRRSGKGALALGFTLGAAYLVKFVALSLAPLFVILALVPHRGARWRLVGRISLGFALVGAPWIAALSARYGRLDAGDTGRLNYGWYVAHVGSQTPRAGATTSSSWTRVRDNPAVFTFTGDAFGTYPVWSDPVRWSTSPRPPFSPSLQLKALAHESANALGTLLPLLLTLALAAALPANARGSRGSLWPLGLLAMAGFGEYCLVHVEGRLLAPFVPLAACALLARISAVEQPSPRRAVLNSVACGVFTVVVCVPLVGLEAALWTIGAPMPDTEAVPSINAAMTRLVADAGAPEGTRVAVIGPVLGASGVERRSRLTVRAEIPRASVGAFWNATPEHRDCILGTLFDAGARAVLAVSYFPKPVASPWTLVSPLVAVRPLATRPPCAEVR